MGKTIDYYNKNAQKFIDGTVAVDGSEVLCKIASEYTGIVVKKMLFQELDSIEKYDGICACASILHAKKIELPEILGKMSAAVKRNGIIYVSFKYGEFEGERNERYFTDMTEKVDVFLLSHVVSKRV